MANTIHVTIVSPEAKIFSGKVELLVAPAVQGEIGIAAKHTPLLTSLQPGLVRAITATEEEVFYVAGGLLEVQPNLVTILADVAIRAHDVDEAAAKEAQERARRELVEQRRDVDYSAALAELTRTAAQLRALQRIRKLKEGRG